MERTAREQISDRVSRSGKAFAKGPQDLFRSAERPCALPEHVEVLPGAFSGSVCGRGLSGKATSTIGFERRFNRAFALTNEEAFVARMLQEIPPRPERAGEIRAENLGAPAAVQR
jgi:hypothetical protein